MSLRIDWEPYEPAPKCGARRPRTNARCERDAEHKDGAHALGPAHIGRDSRGRWHSWYDPEPETA